MRRLLYIPLLLCALASAQTKLVGPQKRVGPQTIPVGVAAASVTDCGGIDTGGSVTTLTVTSTCNIPVGDVLIELAYGEGNAVITFTPSDSPGNAYTQDVYTHVARELVIYRTVITSGKNLVSGTSTVTLAFSASQHWHIEIFDMHPALASPVDQATGAEATGDNGPNPMAVSIANGSATTNANDVVFGAFSGCGADPLGSYGSGFTGLYHGAVANGSGAMAEYKVVSSTGTQSATASMACGFTGVDGAIVAYKAF